MDLPTVTARSPSDAADRFPGGEHRRLGRTVEIEQAPRRLAREHPAERVGSHDLAADQEPGEPTEGCRCLPRRLREQRRREIEHLDAFVLQARRQVGGGDHRFLRDADDPRAVGQSPPQLERRRVEGVGRALPEANAGARRRVVERRDEPDERTVRDRDPFGGPRRSRGVHHVGKVLGQDVGAAHPRTLRGGILAAPVDLQDGDLDRGQTLAQAGLDQQDGGLAVLDHEGQPRRGVARIERQVGAARLEHGEEGHHDLDRALHAQSDAHLRPHAETAQPAGQPVRPPVEAGVAQLLPTVVERDGVGPLERLALETLVDHAAGEPPSRGRGKLHDHLMALGGGEESHLSQALGAAGGEVVEHGAQLREQALDRGGVEAPRIELHRISSSAPGAAISESG